MPLPPPDDPKPGAHLPPMVRVHCAICLEYHPIDETVFLECGHGFCADSLKGHRKAGSRTCPSCREKLTRARRIYAEFEATAAQVAASILARTGADTRALAVRGEDKVDLQAAGGLDIDGEEVAALRLAISELQGSIVSVSGSYDAAREESARLKAQLQAAGETAGRLAEEKTRSAALERRIRHLQQRAEEQEGVAEGAIKAAEDAVAETLRLRAENEGLKGKAEQLRAENRQLQEYLNGKVNEASKWKHKTKAFEREVGALKSQVEGLEAELKDRELQVLPSDYSDATVARKRRRTLSFDSFDENYDAPSDMRVLSPSSQHRRHASHTPLIEARENLPKSDAGTEGLPPPGFRSSWQISDRSRKPTSKTSDRPFPLELDNKGHVSKLVATGHRRRPKA